MTTGGIMHGDRDVAVFARNHRKYVEAAAKISSTDPKAIIVFRARTKWASAMHALGTRRPRPIYIAPIGGDGMVEYIAELQEIMLKPQRGQARAEELLRLTLESTWGEELWEDERGPRVKTLYAISNCRRITASFPMTDLVKVADGKPISENYGYSYSLVYPYAFTAEEE